MKRKATILVNAVFIISMSGLTQAQTWRSMISPTTEVLTDIWGFGPNNVFAVGHSGTILHYDGDGNNDGIADDIWEQMSSPTTEELLGIWGASASDIWAGGKNSTILRLHGGGGWQEMAGIPTNAQINAVGGTGPDDVYAAGEWLTGGGLILHWNGLSWTDDHGSISGPLGAPLQFNDVWGKSSSEVFIDGHNGVSNSLEGVCYTYNGAIWTWNWSGNGWPKMRTYYGICDTGDGMFIVGERYGSQPDWCAIAAHYDGHTWDTQIFADSACLNDVHGISSSSMYMVGRSGKIVKYDGTAWLQMDSGTTQTLIGVWASSSDDIFVVGTNGTILRLSQPTLLPKVVTEPATDIGTTSATLNGRIDDDGGEACEWRFDWWSSDMFGSCGMGGALTTGQSFQLDIDGLKPGTLHYFRAYANNSAGFVGGNIESFTTLPKCEGTLLLLNPNGGEELVAGSTYEIKWQSTGTVQDVLLEYSADNGATWTDVNTVPNTSSYMWEVPDVNNSQQCLVRVSGAACPEANDTSDSVFTIYRCTLAYDLNSDCYVDFYDFALFALEWLECGNPFDPNCQ